jgi:micrococcal nuclease
MRSKLVWIAFFAVLALLGTGKADELLSLVRSATEQHGSSDARVTRVVDGDTIKVSQGGETQTVRYIGVDTPETKRPGTPVQCYGKAASAYNEKLVDGERVKLRFDRERRDRYGRLLAYVYRKRDGLFVNAALVRKGYARSMPFKPNTAHATQFARLQHKARQSNVGLWRTC